MSLKVFNLRCANEHAFEGWFRSAADFEAQQDGRLLSCPLCSSTTISKALSAPYVKTGASQVPVAEHAGTAGGQPALLPAPAQLQAMLVKMVREIAANTEDVGDGFAAEARRIHYSEAPERGIRGVTSRDEARALADEGIAVLPIPFSHLLKDPLH